MEVTFLEVTKRKEYKISYLIDERKLRELANIFMTVSDKITLSVDCVDGKSINFNSVDELVAYPNRKKSRYETIEISNSYSSEIKLSITFGNREFRSVSYRITAEEDKVDYYSGKIEDFIFSLKQWHNFLYHEFIFFLMVIMFSLGTGYLIGLYRYNTITNLVFTSLSIMAYMFLISFIRKILFPIASFKLGDGIERVEKNKSIQSYVITGIFVSGLLGYLINQIPSIFK
jgi:hypothetical protein